MNEQPDQTNSKEEADAATPRAETEEKKILNTRTRLEKKYNAKIIAFNMLETDTGYIDLASWLQTISRHQPKECILILLPNDSDGIKIRFYTNDHIYSIFAKLPGSKPREKDQKEYLGYLGCVVSTRKARTGEYWNRGNDLADGPYNFDTWTKIMEDIIGYELQRIKIEI